MDILSRIKRVSLAPLRKKRYLEHLREAGAKISKLDNAYTIQLHGVNFIAQMEDELFIAEEIFVSKCYNFETKHDCVVYDIGMNVGLASLYFATKQNVKTVYSFELFAPTYALAIENLKLNPTLSKKIHPSNFGIAGDNSAAELEYSSELKGSMGISGPPKPNYVKRSSIRKIPVQFKAASDVLGPLLQRDTGLLKILKLDIEGGEYDVIRNLNNTKLLGDLNIIMMEWHRKNPNEIVSALQENGFSVFDISNGAKPHGMIYASK